MKKLKGVLFGFLVFSSGLMPMQVQACDHDCNMKQQQDHANEMNAQGARNSGEPSTTNNQDLVDELKKTRQKGHFDNYYAVAFHPDASDVFIMGGATKREAAENDARLLCGVNMLVKAGADNASAEKCAVVFSSYNNVASFARGMNGDFYYAWDADTSKSDAAVLANCRKQNDFCTVFRQWVAHPTTSYAPTQESHQPEGNFRKVYASAAWQHEQSSKSPVDNVVYVTGGHATKAAAEQAAVEACQLQSEHPCTAARTVADTFIVVMQRSDKQVSITSSPTEDMVATIAKEVCGAGLTCTVTSIVPASQTGVTKYVPFAKK